MKKILCLILTMICVLFVGCGNENVDTYEAVINQVEEDTNTSETDEIGKDETSFSYADLSGIEFCFCSGAGAWSTTMTIGEDGSFEGLYCDADMGDAGEDYPDGIRYWCKFSGQLSELTKIDELTYMAELTNISYEDTVGKEEYADGVRYIYTDAYGLDNAGTLYFYLPGTKRENLSEDCLSWVSQVMYDEDYNPVEELNFVCLYNKEGEEAFYSYNVTDNFMGYDSFYEEQKKYITIDLSTVKETHIEGDAVTPWKLKILSEEDNGIDWANDWYKSEHLSLPMLDDYWDYFYDDVYEYQWIGDQLYIYEKETGNCIYVLDYPTDKWYVNGNNAYLEDGIFYGASVTNGYAQPDTCFMFAYDLDKEELLWRSADQSYNTMNFVVKGDVIICGYGFTDEKDYLYQINKNTGEIIDRMELKKMPDLLVEQDGKLYVHTYSYNYVIEID